MPMQNTADPRMLELLSYYRDAELHGATLLLRLLKLMRDDSDVQVKLTLHVAQETQHAWLWTKRITDLGGLPMPIADGYQKRIGLRTRPRSVTDLLALTLVVEVRSLARYREHAARPGVDEATLEVLRRLAAEEDWHLRWMREKLDELIAGDPAAQARARELTERYRRIDAEVYRELATYEDEVFGAEGP
jgi:bacterioferritin (cytochrome b1)